MPGRTPNEAFERYISPLRDALVCVTQHRLTLRERRPLRAESEFAVALNDDSPVPLRGQYDLTLRVVQRVRIERDVDGALSEGRYSGIVCAYIYGFATSHGPEILSFHWTPESPDPAAIRFPHAHIGPAITAGQTVLRPGDLHRAHIPTGHVSLPAVIRLAIGEFGVVPLHDDWETRLAWCEAMLSGEARS